MQRSVSGPKTKRLVQDKACQVHSPFHSSLLRKKKTLHEFLLSNLLSLHFKPRFYIWTNLNQRADVFLCFSKSMWLIILSFSVNIHSVTNTFPRLGLSYISDGEKGITFSAARLIQQSSSFISQLTVHPFSEERAE